MIRSTGTTAVSRWVGKGSILWPTALILLLLCMAMPALAYWAPLQESSPGNMTVSYTQSGTTHTVSFGVQDPDRGWVSDDWQIGGSGITIIGPTITEGMIYWVKRSGTGTLSYTVVCEVYDPHLGEWKQYQNTFTTPSSAYMSALSANDGVLAWHTLSGSPSYSDNVYCVTYDPARQMFDTNNWTHGGSSYNFDLVNQDGVVAWCKPSYSSGEYNCEIVYCIYDPATGGWDWGSTSEPSLSSIPSVWISEATVHWLAKAKGYNYATGTWVNSTTTVLPYAYASPSESDGDPLPLRVWFTDMSIGPSSASRSWTFGDGGTSSFKSPSAGHLYTQPDLWTAQLTVAGGTGSWTANIKTDYQDPQNAAISIDDGHAYTRVLNPHLDLSATDNSVSGTSGMQMMISNVYTFQFAQWEPYSAVKANWDLGGTADGTRTVYVKYRDKAGNECSSVSDSIIVDRTAPTVPSGVSDSGEYSRQTALTFTWNASTDSGSGVKEYYYEIAQGSTSTIVSSGVAASTSVNYTGTNGQRYFIHVKARDNVSNESSYSSWSNGITIDTTTPTVPGTPTDAGEFTTNTALNFTWTASTDGTSSVANYDYQVAMDNTSNIVYTGNTTSTNVSYTGTSGHRYYLHARANDGAGNQSAYSSWSDGILVDTTLPTVPAGLSDGGQYTNNTSLTFGWAASTDNDSGILNYNYEITRDGTTTVVNSGTTTSTSVSYTGADGHSYYFHVRANDRASNSSAYSSWSDGIVVDTTAPGAPAVTDPGQYTKNSSVNYTWTCSDGGSGISSYEYQVAMDNVSNIITTSTTTSSQVTIAVVDGHRYYFRVRATDRASNTGNYSAWTSGILADSTVPSVPGNVSDNGQYSTTTSLTFTWSAGTDGGSGILNYTYEIARGTTSNVVYTGTTASTQATYTGTTGYQYFIRVRANDRAGNSSAYSGWTDGITVDAVHPAVSSTNPANNATNVPITGAITLTFSETVNLDAVNESTFTLTDNSTSATVTGTVSHTANTVTFTIPSPGLTRDTSYTARLAAGVTDLAGNSWLQSPYTWSFTTTGKIATLASGSVNATMADLNGDGSVEVILGSSDHVLHAYQADGTELSGWPQTLSGSITNSPAVGDVDRDGQLEVVAVCRPSGYEQVYVFQTNGTLETGWPQGGGEPVTCDPICTPALGDIDGDGDLEIVIGSSTMSVWAYHHNGAVVNSWPQPAMDPVYDTPALGDIDGDGALEVVAGDTAGCLWAWNGNGTLLSTWPTNNNLGLGAITASPALADFDNDGKQEIVLNTHTYGQNGGWLTVLNENAAPLSGWPMYCESGLQGSPAIGDIDGDGDADIVAAYDDGYVASWTVDANFSTGWPSPCPDLSYVDVPMDYTYLAPSPVIADVDGDGQVEIVMGTYGGQVYILENNGTALSGWPRSTSSPIRATAGIGNMDGDSAWDIVIVSDDGGVHRWEVAGNTAATPANLFPWPTFHGDKQASGNFRVMGLDKFTRTDWYSWDSATYGGPWSYLDCLTGSAWAQAIYANGTQGCVEPGMNGMTAGVCTFGQPSIDADVVTTMSVSDSGGISGVVARTSAYNTFYAATYDFSNTELRLEKNVAGVRTTLQSASFQQGFWLARVRLQVEGQTIKAKVWEDGTAEPTTWTLTATDTSPLPAGKAGVWVDDFDMLYFFDDYLAESLSR